jgi:hypothetical protein
MKNGEVKLQDGTILWYKDDVLHNENGPAMYLPDGTMAWYKDGNIHSYNDKPALITPDGFKSWYDSGVRHRTNGPAIVKPDGDESYYYLGYYAPDKEVFYLRPWRSEVEGLVAGINDAPDMSKYLDRDENFQNDQDDLAL